MSRPVPSVAEFKSGIIYQVGDRVYVHSRYGSRGYADVIGFCWDRGGLNVCVAMDFDADICYLDKPYKLRDGLVPSVNMGDGLYHPLAVMGVSGGCLTHATGVHV